MKSLFIVFGIFLMSSLAFATMNSSTAAKMHADTEISQKDKDCAPDSTKKCCAKDKAEKKDCPTDCKKECCKKKSCDKKTEEEKTACAKEKGKKACCAKKTEAEKK